MIDNGKLRCSACWDEDLACPLCDSDATYCEACGATVAAEDVIFDGMAMLCAACYDNLAAIAAAWDALSDAFTPNGPMPTEPRCECGAVLVGDEDLACPLCDGEALAAEAHADDLDAEEAAFDVQHAEMCAACSCYATGIEQDACYEPAGPLCKRRQAPQPLAAVAARQQAAERNAELLREASALRDRLVDLYIKAELASDAEARYEALWIKARRRLHRRRGLVAPKVQP